MQIKNFTIYRGDNTNLSWPASEDLSGKALLFAVKSTKILNGIRLIEKTPIYNTGNIYTTIDASDTENILYQNLYYDLVNVTDNITLATGKIILQADVITKSDGYLQGQIDDDSINNYSVWSSQKTNNELQAEATARQNTDTTLQNNINNEANLRTSADANLQSQITTLQTLQSAYDLRYAIKEQFSPPNRVIFDGVDDYYSVADNPNLNFGTGDFSIEVYLKFNSLSGTQIIFWKGSLGSGTGYGLYKTSSSNQIILTLTTDGTESIYYIGSFVFEVDRIYHIVISLTRNSTAKLYVNGAYIGESNITNRSGSVNSSVNLQISSTTSIRLNGNIYLFRLYNRALSQSDVTYLYNNGMPHLVELPYADTRASQTVLTSGTLQISKRYRIDNYVSGDDFMNVANVESGTINTTGCIFVAKGTTPTTWSNGSSLRQIGCVVEYKSENAGTQGWIETQNGLHASGVGNPTVTAGLRDYRAGITNTTVQFVNSQKAQTILKQIVVKNNYAGSNTVSLGTSTNANELLNAIALANGETKVIDVNSYSAIERSLYCKAGSSNIDVTLIFDKVAR